MKSFDIMVGNTIHSQYNIIDYAMVHVATYIASTTVRKGIFVYESMTQN